MTKELIAVDVGDRYFISMINRKDNRDDYNVPSPDFMFFNGERAERSFDSDWVYIPKTDAPLRIERMGVSHIENERYELIDKSMESEKFPLVFNRDDVTYVDDDGDRVWTEKYAMYRSLYTYERDIIPGKLELLDIPFNVVMTLNDFKEPVFDREFISGCNVIHQKIDKMFFPSIVMHTKKCMLSSHDVYKTLRAYIKQNIDYKYAEIRQDYDFVVVVNKKIKLNTPCITVTETKKANGKSYAKPRIHTTSTEEKSIQVFNMTYAGYERNGKGYNNYNVVPAIKAENEEELNERMKEICETVMEEINAPLIECPHCNGSGVISIKEILVE